MIDIRTDTHAERILIIDFGSQLTQLIARRVRESGVYSEVHPFNKVSAESIRGFAPKGVILSGGPASAASAETPHAPAELFDGSLGLPVLGICYGEMTMVSQTGGAVIESNSREFGRAFVDVTESCPLFDGVWAKGERHQVWLSHGDKINTIPDRFRVVGTSESSPFAIITDGEQQLYGVQFHPEVVHTPDGARLLFNFTHKICGCSGDWSMAAFKNEAIEKIRAQVGDSRVICGFPGASTARSSRF